MRNANAQLLNGSIAQLLNENAELCFFKNFLNNASWN